MPDINTLKAELNAGIAFVQQLPPKPLTIELIVAEELLKMQHYAISKKDKCASMFALQINKVSEFYEDGINLERHGGQLREVTVKSIIKTVRRFMGFANKAFKVPLDICILADGMLIAQYSVFLRLRNEESHNNSYLEATLRNIIKVLYFIAHIQQAKQEGVAKLIEGTQQFIKQLHTISIQPELNTHDLVEQGTALEYEELVVRVLEASSQFMKNLDCSLEKARKLQDFILAAMLTTLPAQRCAVFASLQVVNSKEELVDSSGNFIYWSEKEQAYFFVINKHKMMHKVRIPPFQIPSGSILVDMLNHWTQWAQELILEEEFEYNAENEGCAFFNSRGAPFSVDSFYNKIKSLFKEICKDDKLKIGARVLRHLLADSDLYETQSYEQRQHVAFLAGHSKETEEKVYKSKAPSSKQLTSAAAFCHERQMEAVRRSHDEKSAAEDLLLLMGEEEEEEGHIDLTKSVGRAAVHKSAVRKLPKERVLAMSTKEMRFAFEMMYEAPTESGNQAWLFQKLTGLSKDEYTSPRKRMKPSKAAESDED